LKHLISIHDVTSDEIKQIFKLAQTLKRQLKEGLQHHLLSGKTLGMIFSKSSTRTRVSFEVGIYQLGGYPLFLNLSDIQLGRGETISDTARVLSRYLNAIMIRTYNHSDVEELAKHSSIPVINGLTDLAHPCQALTDLFTVYENRHSLKGLKLAYIGDGNNVANSLLQACSKLGMDISVATPQGYGCNKNIIEIAKQDAQSSGSKIILTNNPEEAIHNADVVYTDTWVSMGQEDEKQKRINIFRKYQVNAELFSKANEHAMFLHCLPAYREYEVTEDVIDGPNSFVLEEAENRMHIQKAIMVMLMG
jgi:ornithine carbamoyltransferase